MRTGTRRCDWQRVAILLQQLVLSTVATVRGTIRQVLRAIQLHGDARLGTVKEFEWRRGELEPEEALWNL
jgi:hypothetical protein